MSVAKSMSGLGIGNGHIQFMEHLMVDLKSLSIELKKQRPSTNVCEVRQGVEDGMSKIKEFTKDRSNQTKDVQKLFDLLNSSVLTSLANVCTCILNTTTSNSSSSFIHSASNTSWVKSSTLVFVIIQRIITNGLVDFKGAKIITTILWNMVQNCASLSSPHSSASYILSSPTHHTSNSEHGYEDKEEIKILQTATLLLTCSDVVQGEILAKNLSICIRLSQVSDASVSCVAGATVRQLVPLVFERIQNNDKKKEVAAECKTGGMGVSDGHLILQDIVTLIVGDCRALLTLSGITKNISHLLAIDLIMSILDTFPSIFHTYDHFAALLSKQICPLVIRLFAAVSDQRQSTTDKDKAFAKLMTVVQILIVKYHGLLRDDSAVFLNLLVTFLEPQRGYGSDKKKSAISWKNCLALEVVLSICRDPNLVKFIVETFDSKVSLEEKSTRVVIWRNILTSLSTLIQDCLNGKLSLNFENFDVDSIEGVLDESMNVENSTDVLNKHIGFWCKSTVSGDVKPQGGGTRFVPLTVSSECLTMLDINGKSTILKRSVQKELELFIQAAKSERIQNVSASASTSHMLSLATLSLLQCIKTISSTINDFMKAPIDNEIAMKMAVAICPSEHTDIHSCIALLSRCVSDHESGTSDILVKCLLNSIGQLVECLSGICSVVKDNGTFRKDRDYYLSLLCQFCFPSSYLLLPLCHCILQKCNSDQFIKSIFNISSNHGSAHKTEGGHIDEIERERRKRRHVIVAVGQPLCTYSLHPESPNRQPQFQGMGTGSPGNSSYTSNLTPVILTPLHFDALDSMLFTASRCMTQELFTDVQSWFNILTAMQHAVWILSTKLDTHYEQFASKGSRSSFGQRRQMYQNSSTATENSRSSVVITGQGKKQLNLLKSQFENLIKNSQKLSVESLKSLISALIRLDNESMFDLNTIQHHSTFPSEVMLEIGILNLFRLQPLPSINEMDNRVDSSCCLWWNSITDHLVESCKFELQDEKSLQNSSSPLNIAVRQSAASSILIVVREAFAHFSNVTIATSKSSSKVSPFQKLQLRILSPLEKISQYDEKSLENRASESDEIVIRYQIEAISLILEHQQRFVSSTTSIVAISEKHRPILNMNQCTKSWSIVLNVLTSCAKYFTSRSKASLNMKVTANGDEKSRDTCILVKNCFESVQSIFESELITVIPVECLPQLVDVIFQFAVVCKTLPEGIDHKGNKNDFSTSSDVNISLTAVNLLWQFSDFLLTLKDFECKDVSESSGAYFQKTPEKDSESHFSRVDNLWLYLYTKLSEIVRSSSGDTSELIVTNIEVRKSAAQTLFSTLAAHGQKVLTENTWAFVMLKLLIPLLKSITVEKSSSASSIQIITVCGVVRVFDTCSRSVSPIQNVSTGSPPLQNSDVNLVHKSWCVLLDCIENLTVNQQSKDGPDSSPNNIDVSIAAIKAMNELIVHRKSICNSPVIIQDDNDDWIRCFGVWLNIGRVLADTVVVDILLHAFREANHGQQNKVLQSQLILLVSGHLQMFHAIYPMVVGEGSKSTGEAFKASEVKSVCDVLKACISIPMENELESVDVVSSVHSSALSVFQLISNASLVNKDFTLINQCLLSFCEICETTLLHTDPISLSKNSTFKMFNTSQSKSLQRESFFSPSWLNSERFCFKMAIFACQMLSELNTFLMQMNGVAYLVASNMNSHSTKQLILSKQDHLITCTNLNKILTSVIIHPLSTKKRVTPPNSQCLAVHSSKKHVDIWTKALQVLFTLMRYSSGNFSTKTAKDNTLWHSSLTCKYNVKFWECLSKVIRAYLFEMDENVSEKDVQMQLDLTEQRTIYDCQMLKLIKEHYLLPCMTNDKGSIDTDEKDSDSSSTPPPKSFMDCIIKILNKGSVHSQIDCGDSTLTRNPERSCTNREKFSNTCLELLLEFSLLDLDERPHGSVANKTMSSGGFLCSKYLLLNRLHEIVLDALDAKCLYGEVAPMSRRQNTQLILALHSLIAIIKASNNLNKATNEVDPSPATSESTSLSCCGRGGPEWEVIYGLYEKLVRLMVKVSASSSSSTVPPSSSMSEVEGACVSDSSPKQQLLTSNRLTLEISQVLMAYQTLLKPPLTLSIMEGGGHTSRGSLDTSFNDKERINQRSLFDD